VVHAHLDTKMRSLRIVKLAGRYLMYGVDI